MIVFFVHKATFYATIGAMNRKAHNSKKPTKKPALHGARPSAPRSGRGSRAQAPAPARETRERDSRGQGSPASKRTPAAAGTVHEHAPSARTAAAGTGASCPVEAQCGACEHVSMPYGDQLALKQRSMEDLFADWAPQGAVRPILGMDDPFHYRNKVTSPFAPGRRIDPAESRGRSCRAYGRDGRTAGKGKAARAAAPRHEILTGMYAAHSHRLVPTDACLLENQQAKAVIAAVRDLMPRFGLLPYREDAHAGFVRHAVVRVGHESGEVLVTLVTNGKEFPGSRAFCRELVRRCPFVTTVVQNVNLRQTNVILGEEERTLYGPGFILDTLCGLSFRISSHSFYQVNAVQTEVLYERAIDLAGFTGSETAIDAYCGTGTIGLVAAKRGARQVIGVDTVASAVRDARENAKHNGVENARFAVGDAGAFMRERAAAGDAVDVLLMDPPRAGSSEEFLAAAVTLAPRRIVYISCNPTTQVRDLAFLRQRGYAVRTVQPVDMFPHTDHIETVAVLSRKSATKTFIPVTVSPKDMGLDEAKAQPTYENIRKYVKETHGLTVSTLNIAQMKAECGLEMECDRSGGKQQPKCPPEKREAILDAFRHFGMIEDDSSEG